MNRQGKSRVLHANHHQVYSYGWAKGRNNVHSLVWNNAVRITHCVEFPVLHNAPISRVVRITKTNKSTYIFTYLCPWKCLPSIVKIDYAERTRFVLFKYLKVLLLPSNCDWMLISKTVKVFEKIVLVPLESHCWFSRCGNSNKFI